MRLVKSFGLAAFSAVVAMVFVGATSAVAFTSTQLCTAHTGLDCSTGTSSVHLVLEKGEVGRLLSDLVVVLCLGVLVEATPLALGQPQSVHSLTSEYTGCGTGTMHSNCTVSVEQEPLTNLLKTGLDTGSLTATDGETLLLCPNLGIDCTFDAAGILFSVGAQKLTAADTWIKELGGDFFCPGHSMLDGILKTLTNTYILR